MDSFITLINTTGKSFIEFSTSMLIQSSVLIILLLLLDLLLRKKVRAVFLYCIWMLILVKLVLPTTLSSPTGLGYWLGDKVPDIISQKASIPEQTVLDLQKTEPVSETIRYGTGIATVPSASVSQKPVADVTSAKFTNVASPTKVSFSWQGFAFLGWFAVVITMVLLLIKRMLSVRSLLAKSKKPNDSLLDIFGRCCKHMGVRRSILLKLSPYATSPSACGFFQPTILIPHELKNILKIEDLKPILLHELAHIKRGDLWISLIQTILQIAYFYNPLLWVANVIIRKVREQAVDEMVLVAMGEQAGDYPETLLNISRLTLSRPVISLHSVGIVESRKALYRRIKQMLNRPIPQNAKLGIRGLMMILILGAVLLPMARAQKQSTENTAVDSDAQSKYASETTKVDIAIEDKDLEVIKLSDRLFEATISLRNKDSVPIPRFRVNFCAGDPDKGGRLLSAQAAGPIMPGETWREYNPGLKLEPGENTISVVVDPDNQVDESDETNNKASKTVTMFISDSEKVVNVGAIQKVNLAGDDILQIETQEAKGFNFPFYLFIPRGIDKDKPVYMLVEPNNSGMVSDDLEFHQARALKLVERSYATQIASRLDVPLLVPTFPRPKTDWWVYTHALDIDTLEITEGKLKRIDLQLTAMIKYAQELLRMNGFKINEKVFMDGFSASAKFCNRYSFLHPEMVKAVAAGGVNGLPTLPIREWNGCELPFPIGIAGIEKFIDGPFNEEAFREVAHYIYMGSLDRNDTLPSRDAWREEEADIIKKALAEKMMPDRWELSQKIYSQQKVHAQLVTYNGVTHAIKKEMEDDVINFFKANSGEDYVRIKPYEYPAVKFEESSPKYQTGSAKVDIAIKDQNLIVRKQPDGSIYAEITIHNEGSHPLPQFGVNFYAGDPDKGGRLLSAQAAGPIMPGDSWGEYNPGLILRDAENTISVVVDPGNKVEESDETNNKASVVIPGRQLKKPVETDTSNQQTTQAEAKITPREKEEPAGKVSGIDISPAHFDILLDNNRGICELVVSIQNESSLTIPRFKLRFYRGDPANNLDEAGSVQKSWHYAGPIEPGKHWSEGTGSFHLPDGQYEFSVVLDFDNSISEINENNNRAELKVKIEDGQITEKSITCPSTQKDLKTDVQDKVKGVSAESKITPEMAGTWFFDNPYGDEEQMAVFPDGHVVVLYSNGHNDQTNIVSGYIELAEYKNVRCRMAVREDGTLVQYFGQGESSGKQWRRISPEPHTNLLGALSDSWRFEGKYLAKLSDDVTVELVGVCDWPKEGKRCWRPDGSQLPMEIYASKWNIEPKAGQYGFIYKVTGPDDIKLSCRINGASQTEGSCEVVDGLGNQLKDLTASVSDTEKGRLSTTVRAGVAAGPWKTISSHEGNRMEIGRENTVLWSQAFQNDSGTYIVASREWQKDQNERVIAIDKDGKIHTTGQGGSVSSGKIHQLTSNFGNLKLEQIKEFQYQIRPYQWVEFKNVSLKPGHETDVEF
jgi:beta-lactamase regulating signal transducer with metallopeptidase domain